MGLSFDGIDGFDTFSIRNFFARLSIGTIVTVQFDDRPPATGRFQGFQGGAVLLANFDGFPGLARLNINRINAVSV